MNPIMVGKIYSFSELQDIVEKEINKIPLESKPKELYEPVSYILSIGGKRLRPIMLLMSYNLYSDSITKALSAALAVEVFHNFTLLHDDIMDNAGLRRNHLTVHEKWNKNIAILSGDAMLIKAYELMNNTSYHKLSLIFEVFNKTALQVCEGQQYDMNFENSQLIEIREYLEMIELKTAVLLAGSMKIGALLGGCDLHDADAMYAFGKNLGISFQLQDDLLDTYGDPKKFGKKIGGDIVNNKKTYLLLKAYSKADEKDRKILMTLMMDKKVPETNKINRVKEIFDKLDIQRETENIIDFYFNEAFKYLRAVSVPDERKSGIRELAGRLMNRSS